MPLVPRPLRYLQTRVIANMAPSNQEVARGNAAEASATLQERRGERETVDAYLQAVRRGDGEL